MKNLSVTDIEKIINLVKRGEIVGHSIVDNFLAGDHRIEKFIYINYTERFTACLTSVSTLLEVYKTDPAVETSIGLILRASLLDYITITYLVSFYADIKSENNIDGINEYNKQFNTFLCDHISKTFTYLDFCKRLEIIDMNEHRQAVENIYQEYIYLFNKESLNLCNPKENLIERKSIPISKMVERIKKHPFTEQQAMAYDAYTYYSKYEHFGIMTHSLQRQGTEHDLTMIKTSIKYVFKGLGFSLAFLNYPEETLKDQQTEVQELIADAEIL